MKLSSFIRELKKRNIEFREENDSIIILSQHDSGDIYLRDLELIENVIFQNEGDVYLQDVTELPAGTRFHSFAPNRRKFEFGSVELPRCERIHEDVIRAHAIPIVPQIDKRIFDIVSIRPDKLNMSRWHGRDVDAFSLDSECSTTHCRAGWAVHLAGAQGYALERRYNPETAGALIYIASRPGRKHPSFYDNNDEAMNDLKRCAEEQSQEAAQQ